MVLFSSNPGVIYNPRVTRLNCVYGGDGGTRKLPDDGCGSKEGFCDRSERDGWCDGRAHDPKHLDAILRGGLSAPYNEAVINTASIAAHLPGAVDAIFFILGDGDRLRAARQHAEQAHRAFVATYPEVAASRPLLCLDPTDLDRPFRTADSCTSNFVL